MSNRGCKPVVVDLTDNQTANQVSLGEKGFLLGDTPCFCRISDAELSLVSDSFGKNVLLVTLPVTQSAMLQKILDDTGRESLPYSVYNGNLQFRIKLHPSVRVVGALGEVLKLDVQKVPCEELRKLRFAIMDLLVTGEATEFTKGNQVVSYASLSAFQAKITRDPPGKQEESPSFDPNGIEFLL